MGYRTVAISSGPQKRDLAMKLGAHDYIDGSTGDVGEQLQKVGQSTALAISGAKTDTCIQLGGASCILFTGSNSDIMPSLLRGLAPLGKLLVLGVSGPVDVNTASMIQKGLSITAWPSGHALDCQEAIAFAENHGVGVMIEKFTLDQANEALQKMIENKVRFRAVLVP
jgi:D-arabinose 1-dehydrogenase-like Zn-dependent alcohol dehydrogenase